MGYVYRGPMSSGPVHIVVMGVSATGKTSVATEMAARLGCDFIEGDSHHPPANIAKMEAGVPLTDEDRMPWLKALAELLAVRDCAGRSTVLTCSALRRAYRDVLRTAVPGGEIFFVHLSASIDVLRDRMSQRTKHFMPTSLLQSQFDTLEPLEADEAGAMVDVTPPLEDVVSEAVNLVRARYGG